MGEFPDGFWKGLVMFESDQHEFDEEYEEPIHQAPPPPVAKPSAVEVPAAMTGPAATAAPVAAEARFAAAAPVATAVPVAAAAPASAPAAARVPAPPVAVEEPIVEEPQHEEAEESYDTTEEFFDPAQREEVPPPPKKGPGLLLMAGFAGLVIFAIFVVYTATRPKDNAPPPGDMGPGIVAVSGLRGHLNTRWDGNAKTGRLVYQLHIEPMEDRWQAGFSQVTTNAPMPISVNVRLLDATGFALCGKEIDFRFNPQNASAPVAPPPLVGSDGKKLSPAERNAAMQAERQAATAQMQAAEVARESGKDIFQNQLTNDGQVTAVNVQGALPCSPDQFKRASYWDFNTNFPTLDEQAALLDPRGTALRAREAELGLHPKRMAQKPQGGFVIQGDDRVTGYDSVRGTLLAEGRTFQIDRRFGQATATAWADDNSLIHYRCDQQANCALSAAGGTTVLHARLSE